ncbi:MAG: MucR family transcriptional regulator [Desulfovibrionaceae bacterium]|nr:MucR family transcriptional regulator [Desulfovibrionaceae bacterium]
MDDYLKEALEIVRAQASVRVMAEEEIVTLIQRLAADIRGIAEGDRELECSSGEITCDVKKSIKEKSVVCLECGKSFKILTRRHLESHGLNAVSYREKWGLKKDTPLVCKGLQRDRRKKMNDMKLWEKRRKAAR